jgi:microcystin-dependent protein
MSEPYIGQIAIFGFNYAPQNWVFCNGALMSISQNTAFFSVIGTYYGGNGTSTFAVPNIQNCGVVSWGQGPGLSNYTIGETLGVPDVTLTTSQLPFHNHVAFGYAAKANTDYVLGAQNGYWMGSEVRGGTLFNTGISGATFAPSTIGLQGGSQPHINQQPFLGMNFCIAQTGIFPTRS